MALGACACDMATDAPDFDRARLAHDLLQRIISEKMALVPVELSSVFRTVIIAGMFASHGTDSRYVKASQTRRRVLDTFSMMK